MFADLGSTTRLKVFTPEGEFDSVRLFNEWLAGLIDAEGTVYGSGLYITMSSQEVETQEQIRAILGVGKIVPVKGADACRLYITVKDHGLGAFQGVLIRINGNIRNSVRREQCMPIFLRYGIAWINPLP